MRRALVIWFFVAALVAMGCSPPPDSFGSVRTLDDSWIEIWDWYDLDAIRDNLEGNYLLMNNLGPTTAGYTELAGPAANGGKGWQPVTPFDGAFEGQGHEIWGLFINRPDENEVGLFGRTRASARIMNVGLKDVNVTGNDYVGGLVGRNVDGTVSNSYSTGNVIGNEYVGGLVGTNSRGTVSRSYSTGSVTGTGSIVGGLAGSNHMGMVSQSYSTASVTGNARVGGLVGSNWEGTVSQSYSTGSVTGERSEFTTVGGLVGNMWYATVTDSYSTSSVTGRSYVGGLVGSQDRGTVRRSYSTGSVTGSGGGLVGHRTYGTISDSFWDTETSGRDASDGGTGKTTAEMNDIDTFLNAVWDIELTSEANPTQGYPFLSWQLSNSPTWLIYEDASPIMCDLSISSTDGGLASEPGEGTFTYEDGTVVDLVAVPDTGYHFVNWTGDVSTINDVNSASTTITMNGDYSIVANFEPVVGVQTQCVESATGTGEVCITTSHGFIEDLEALPSIPPAPPADIVFPHGMFSFKVTGLELGQTVTITVELPGPVPSGTRWWKEHMGAWYSIPIPVIEPNVISFTLTDGVFPGDSDKTEDGVITDPGGPGNPVPLLTVGWEGSPVNKAGVIAPWIALLATMTAGAGLLVLRRRLTQN